VEEARSNPLLAGAAIETSMFAVSIKDGEGRYVRANRVYAVLAGIPDDQIQGRTEAEVSARDVAVRLDENDRTALGAGGVTFVEESVLDRVGRRQVASCRFPLVDAAGEPWAVCRVSAPVSDATAVRKDAERLFALASAGGSQAPARTPGAEGEAGTGDASGREAELEARLAKAQGKRDQAREDLARASEERDTAIRERDEARAQLAGTTHGRDDVTRERDETRAQATTLTRERDDARAQATTLSRERDEVVRERDDARAQAATLSRERDDARAQAATLSRERDEARAQATMLSRERDDARAQATTLSRQRDEVVRERDDARTEVGALARERDELQASVAELEARLAAVTTERNEQLDAVARLEGEASTLRHDRDEQKAARAHAQALLERERALILNGKHRHPDIAAAIGERDEARRQLEAARELLADLQRDPAPETPAPAPAPMPSAAAAAEPALGTLCHVIAAIDDATSFETGLHQALAALGDGLGFDALVGWRLDVHGERLICSEIWTAAPVMGLEAFATASWRHALNPGEGIAAAAFQTGRATVRSPLSPGSTSARERDACEAGLVTAIATPILHGDRPTGLIEAFVSDRRVIEPHVLEALAAAGRQLGVFAHLLELAEQPRWRAGVR
jgi:uncharacterized coiled-coil DUF342 family protein